MKHLRILFLVFFVLLIQCELALAQVPLVTEQEVLIELAKRGLDEDQVRLALIKKGIDLNRLDEIDSEGVKIIEATIIELETLKEQEDSLRQEEENSRATEESKEELPEMSIDTLPIEPENTDSDEVVEAAIYGQQLFRDKVIRVFKSGEEFKAPSNYIIGAGDELAISIWGSSQFDSKYTVNDEGYIKILNNSQRVFLKGLTLAVAKEKLRKVFSNSYRFSQGEFDVDLNYSRSVNVNIYGEVIDPGPVTVPAINTAFGALVAASGPNDIGSVRNIQLIRTDGTRSTLDVYKYMIRPDKTENIFLQDNDVILVPVADHIISIEGAVRRPMKYELLKNEGIKELIEYAGDFSENAYTKVVRVKRFQAGKQTILDVDWDDISKGSNFLLNKGDHVFVDTISVEASNYVEVDGAIVNPGVYEHKTNMRVFDLLNKSGLKSGARTDIAFIKRTKSNGTIEYIQINIDAIKNNPQGKENILLVDKDLLTVWSQERFADESKFMINGAVRYPGDFPFDVSQNIQIREALMLAGGLRRDASNVAVIHRKDPLNPKVKEYITIDNLNDIIDNPNLINNVALNAFDSLVIYSKNSFIEESFVRIEGAVNEPGLYQYGVEMTIQDLLTLAGGFKLAAATNNIEVSRVEIKNNQPTRVVIANLDIDRDLKTVNSGQAYFKLEPFDNVAVRFVPEFELQQNVIIQGEVKFPGPYTIINENERISSIISRAGGPTVEAFPGGATLIRSDQGYGAVVIKLDEILNYPKSQFNFTVRDGDTINVPKIREFVTIKGATRAKEVLTNESINEGNVIHVPYHKGKDALFYINQYAGGLHDNADPNAIFVEHPNGEVKQAKKQFIFSKKVEVNKGSVIRIGFKPIKKEGEKDKQDVDWTKVLGDSVAQAMSILTLILLVQRLD